MIVEPPSMHPFAALAVFRYGPAWRFWALRVRTYKVGLEQLFNRRNFDGFRPSAFGKSVFEAPFGIFRSGMASSDGPVGKDRGDWGFQRRSRMRDRPQRRWLLRWRPRTARKVRWVAAPSACRGACAFPLCAEPKTWLNSKLRPCACVLIQADDDSGSLFWPVHEIVSECACW